MRALFLILVAGCGVPVEEFQEGEAVRFLGLDYTGSTYHPQLAACELTVLGDAGFVASWDDEGRITRYGPLTYVWDGPCVTHYSLDLGTDGAITYDASCDEHGWPFETTFASVDEDGAETYRTETSLENTYDGNELVEVSSDEYVLSYTWDRNRVASATVVYADDPASNGTRTFAWNPDGYLLEESDESGSLIANTYDDLGRLTTQVTGSGDDASTATYEYADDAAKWPMSKRYDIDGDEASDDLQYSCR